MAKKNKSAHQLVVYPHLAHFAFVLERLGFFALSAVSKANSNFSSEEYRQRFRIKRRGVSPSPTIRWASCCLGKSTLPWLCLCAPVIGCYVDVRRCFVVFVDSYDIGSWLPFRRIQAYSDRYDNSSKSLSIYVGRKVERSKKGMWFKYECRPLWLWWWNWSNTDD